MECGEQSVTMAGMKEMQLLSVSSWDLDNQVSTYIPRIKISNGVHMINIIYSCITSIVYTILCAIHLRFLLRAHAQRVKQSVCLSVVVGMKIARSLVLGGCAYCKHNQSVDIGENWFVRIPNCSKRLTSTTNCAFSVQHACGLSTTPTLWSSVLERVVKS